MQYMRFVNQVLEKEKKKYRLAIVFKSTFK